MGHSDLVIVSNRGPLSFSRDEDGNLVTSRGAGGLVSCLAPAVAGAGATWVAGAISEEDREAASQGVVEAEGFRLRSLVIESEEYRQFYDVVANSTLWFLHHNLFDLPRRPHIDRRWREAWSTFADVNRQFAEAVADEAPDGGVVLVHDYHLCLVGSTLAKVRPDLRTAHFNHTPFCEPTALRMLPDEVASAVMEGLAANGACGFHSERWAAAFGRCAEATVGSVPPTFVAPAGIDSDDLTQVASSDESKEEFAKLDEQIGDRHFIARIDRIELSKNILRGFLAFEELLRTRPEWRERVMFGAFVYPSRDSIPDYMAYRSEVEAMVERVNNTWSTPSWTPVLAYTEDFFPRSVAAHRRYDVLLVNPIRDGLNLVAKEGPTLNERDGVLVLSRESGAWDEMGEAALGINPFDITDTADALARALSMGRRERAERAARLRAASEGREPQDWLNDQLEAARSPS
ncbi:MAG: trehalose-6-phosphate synthase [Actinomycetota bacterium]|nr:trehalose-6-phosphate synthase [Actinomycetota bacterium]MDQ3575301.1 trehalose-6-phosphate synthase [Actinomycetota bacterium]